MLINGHYCCNLYPVRAASKSSSYFIIIHDKVKNPGVTGGAVTNGHVCSVRGILRCASSNQGVQSPCLIFVNTKGGRMQGFHMSGSSMQVKYFITRQKNKLSINRGVHTLLNKT